MTPKVFIYIIFVLYSRFIVDGFPDSMYHLRPLKGSVKDGYVYYSEIEGYLKLHSEPTDWISARLTCHSEDAVVASPWNAEIMSTISLLRKAHDTLLPNLHSGVELAFREGIYKRNNEGQLELSMNPGDVYGRYCVAFHDVAHVNVIDCGQELPYFCFTPEHPQHRDCGDNEYMYAPETSHCYKFHNVAKTWKEGNKICLREGARLAVINNIEELQVVRKLHARFPSENRVIEASCCKKVAFIGVFYWNATASWWTIDGQPLEQAGISEWEHGYPIKGEPFAAVHKDSNGLFSMEHDSVAAFVCEKIPI